MRRSELKGWDSLHIVFGVVGLVATGGCGEPFHDVPVQPRPDASTTSDAAVAEETGGEDAPGEVATESGTSTEASVPDGSTACEKGWADCDGKVENGCEANLATDAKNCGTCGHDCLGGACGAAMCQPEKVLTGPGSEHCVLSGNQFFYAKDKDLFRYDLGTKKELRLTALPEEPVVYPLVVGKNLFFLGSAGYGAGHVYRVEKDVSTYQTLEKQGKNVTEFSRMFAENEVVYGAFLSQIARVPRESSDVFLADTTKGILFDIYKRPGTDSFYGLDEKSLFTAVAKTHDAKATMTVKYAGFTSAKQMEPRVVGGKVTSLLILDKGPKQLMDASLDTVSIKPVVSNMDGATRFVVADDTAIWATSDGFIRRAPLTTGTTSTLVKGQGNLVWLAVDPKFIYFVDATSAALMRVAR